MNRTVFRRNDVVAWETPEGHVLNRRVLAIEAGQAALIDVDSDKAMPEWEPIEDVRQAVEEGRARIVTVDPKPADLRRNAELPKGIRRMRDRRWNAIQPLVEPAGNGSPLDILRLETRGRLVAGAEASGHGKGNVYTWLRLYWQRGQTVNALLPAYEKAPGANRLAREAAGGKKRGRKSRWELDGHPGLSVTEDVRRLLVRGGKLFYARKYRGRRLSLAQAYHRVLDMFFTERVEAAPDGTLVHVRHDALPTLRQFKYWFGKARRIEKELKDRYSSRRVALRNRPVLGSSEHLSRGPGDLSLPARSRDAVRRRCSWAPEPRLHSFPQHCSRDRPGHRLRGARRGDRHLHGPTAALHAEEAPELHPATFASRGQGAGGTAPRQMTANAYPVTRPGRRT